MNCRSPVLFFRIGFFHIGSAQKIVCADIVEISQFVYHPYRHIKLPQFIIGIGSLVNLQIFSYIVLCQIFIFS